MPSVRRALTIGATLLAAGGGYLIGNAHTSGPFDSVDTPSGSADDNAQEQVPEGESLNPQGPEPIHYGTPEEMATAAGTIATGLTCTIDNIFNGKYMNVSTKVNHALAETIDEFGGQKILGTIRPSYFAVTLDSIIVNAEDALRPASIQHVTNTHTETLDDTGFWNTKEKFVVPSSPKDLFIGDQSGGYDGKELKPDNYAVVMKREAQTYDGNRNWHLSASNVCGAIGFVEGEWQITKLPKGTPAYVKGELFSTKGKSYID